MKIPFQLGVNYWPRKKAMYWWSDFDRGEVRDEFALIAELGLDVVRIFLLWEDFQPVSEQVSTARMAHLEKTLEAAEDTGLKVSITLFTGHMSGPNWAPRWLLDTTSPETVRPLICNGRVTRVGLKNPYSDPVALRAEERLVNEIVGAFHTHPAVTCWSLGNEPAIFAVPKTPAESKAWCGRFISQIKTIGAPQNVTVGLDMSALCEEIGFRVHDVFENADLAVVHGYPMYTPWARSPVDPDFVPYLVALTRSLTGKPTLAEEFGGPTAPPGESSHTIHFPEFGTKRSQYLVAEETFAAYLERTLPKLQAAGAIGAILWCYADYDPSLFNRPPCDQSVHERFFGLVRSDGSPKPHADVLKRFAQSRPEVTLSPTSTVRLDISPDDYYQNPQTNCEALYRQYLIDLGQDPHHLPDID